MEERGRTAVVTGAASGIGRATTELAVREGWRVISVDQREADIVVDLGSREGRREMVAKVQDRTHGVIDSVVACAGVITEDARTIAVNYFGMVETLTGLRPLLARSLSPRAVGIASYGAIIASDPGIEAACLAHDEVAALSACAGLPWQVLYASSKNLFARWIKRHAILHDWAGAGILLNATAPGITRTPMMDVVERLSGGSHTKGYSIPLGREAVPAEQAELLLWLSSRQNSQITGQVIFADGGAEAEARGDRV